MEQVPIPPIPAAQTQPQPQPQTPEVVVASRPEPGPSTASRSGYNDHAAERRVRLQTASIEQPSLGPESDGHASQTRFQDDSHTDLHHIPVQPPPARSHDGHPRTSRRHSRQGSSVGLPTVAAWNTSALDWIVPKVNSGGYSEHGASERQVRLQTSSIEQPYLGPESYSHAYQTRFQDELDHVPRPAQTRECCVTRLFSRRTAARIAPLEEKTFPLTIHQRLNPTINNVIEQREKFARKVRLYRYLINIAIALQVLLGALTTGLAAAVTTVRQGQISTAILGGLATFVASFLARLRGSGEPELSIVRKKDLDYLLREARALDMDHGHKEDCPGDDLDHRVRALRDRLEEFLRKAEGGERKPPLNGNAAHTTNSNTTSTPNATSAANRA